MRLKTNICMVTATVLALGTLAGCTTSEATTSTENDGDKTVIRVGTFGTCAWDYPLIIAQEYGIWDEVFEGEDVELQLTTSFTNGPEANEALTAGQLDVIWGIGDQPILTGIQNGVDLTVLAQASSQDETITIVTDANSELNSISDLKGKKVAVAVGTITHKSLVGVLNDNGISTNDVELVNFTTAGDVVSALTRGDVDAYVGYIFDINDSIKDGTLKSIGDCTGNPASTYIVASSSFVDEYPEYTEKLLQASKEGVEYVEENPQVCYEYISNGTGWSVEDLNELYPLLHCQVSFSADDIADLKNTEQFLIDNEILDGELTNLESEHINTTFLERLGN